MAAVESGLPKVQQEPSDSHRIVVDNNGVENVPEDESRVASSEQPRQDDMECPRAKLSIYRIPDYLKDGDKKAYVPQVVSLGPFHHGKDHLCPMEQHKSRCLHHILARSHHEIGLYLNSVKEVEQIARACYEGAISMSSDEFTKMMVLDGCFVIELLRGVNKGFEELGYPPNDPVFSTWGWMHKIQIKRDMILLENQIPLFILHRLLHLQRGGPDQDGPVGKLALHFFDKSVEFCPSFDQIHCLEVLWRNLLPSDLQQKKNSGWLEYRELPIPCVTELREFGIKLRMGRERKLGDIKFKSKDGILVIPKLMIHEGTRSLFLNLIAFEQSHFDCGNHITSYVIFMHNLMNSSEDVRYLRNHGIIKHCLGSDAEVVDLFIRLCQELPFDIYDSYLYALSQDLRAFCGVGPIFPIPAGHPTRRRWIATLKNTYFDRPWTMISVMNAFAVLVLTFVQAFYAVYGSWGQRS